MRYLVISFFLLVAFTPASSYSQIISADAKGIYQYHLHTGTDKITVKVGNRHWYKHRDKVTVGMHVTCDPDPISMTCTNWGNRLNFAGHTWNFQQGSFETPVTAIKYHEFKTNDEHGMMRMFGFVEGQSQPGRKYYWNGIEGTSQGWDLGIDYALASDISMDFLFRFSDQYHPWDFVYFIPLNVDSTTINGGNDLSETINSSHSHIHYENLPKTSSGGNTGERLSSMGWKSPLREEENRVVAATRDSMLTSIIERVQRSDLLSSEYIVPVVKDAFVKAKMKYSGTIRQREDGQWLEHLAYRGVLMVPVILSEMPEDLDPLTLLDGLTLETNLVDIIQKVTHFRQWVLANSKPSNTETILDIATQMRRFIIEFVQSPETPHVRKSVNMKLFKMLTDLLFNHFLNVTEKRRGQYDASVERTGDSIKGIMEGDQADVEELKEKVQEWLDTLKEHGLEQFAEEVETFLSGIEEDVDLMMVKQQLLEMMRGAVHKILDSKWVIEGFEQKVKMDQDLLHGAEFDLNDIRP